MYSNNRRVHFYILESNIIYIYIYIYIYSTVFLCHYYFTCFEELDLLSIRFEHLSDIRYNFADIDIFFFCSSINNMNIVIVCFTNAFNIMYQ